MSTVPIADGVPVRYWIGALLVALATLAYAVLIGQSLLWFRTALALAALGVSAFALYLFYRLVVAVERIAYGP